MNLKSIAEKIINLKNADLELRARLLREGKLDEGYNTEMEAMHNRHAAVLNDIIDAIGYPTIDLVGKEASEAAWLVIQHAISQPAFMKKCLELLEKAVSEQRADPINLAYLADRIAVFEDRPQLYGTQFDRDLNGQLIPLPYDDLDKVNHRRKAIGLNTLDEQTGLLRKRAEEEGAVPPKDPEKRKQEFDAWRKAAGWLRK